jgi:hypothetical protein
MSKVQVEQKTYEMPPRERFGPAEAVPSNWETLLHE